MLEHNRRWPALITTLFLLLAAAAGPSAAAPKRLTVQQKADLLHVKGLTEPGIPHTLDLSDDVQDRFLKRQMKAAGLFRGRNGRDLEEFLADMDLAHENQAPAQNLTLLQRRGEPGTWHPVAMISQLSKMEGDRYYATGVAAIPDTVHLTLLLQLFDRQDWRPMADPAVARDWFADHLTVSAEGRSGSSEIAAVFVYIYHTEGRPRPTAQVIFRTLGSIPDPTITVTHPARKAGSTCKSGDVDCIKICLGRDDCGGGGGGASDCDYNEKNAGTCQQPALQVSGEVNFGSSQINTTLDRSSIPEYIAELASNFSAKVLHPGDTTASGGCLLDTANFCFSLGANNSSLNWNTGSLTGGLTTEGASCATWDSTVALTEQDDCWSQAISNDAYLHMTFDVPLTDGSTPLITVDSQAVCAQDTDGTVKCIDNLYFAWGCLLAGTPVRMADGSLRAIEEVLVHEKVAAGPGGRLLTVVDTFIGTEDTQETPLVVIEDDRGNTLEMTETHPVVSGRGVLLAKQLEVGDSLTTENGPSTVTRVDRRKAAEPVEVYNLNVGTDDEAVTDENATFFAGSILVGDNRMQGTWERKYEMSEDAIREIPEEWRRDYEKWLKQQKRKKGGG